MWRGCGGAIYGSSGGWRPANEERTERDRRTYFLFCRRSITQQRSTTTSIEWQRIWCYDADSCDWKNGLVDVSLRRVSMTGANKLRMMSIRPTKYKIIAEEDEVVVATIESSALQWVEKGDRSYRYNRQQWIAYWRTGYNRQQWIAYWRTEGTSHRDDPYPSRRVGWVSSPLNSNRQQYEIKQIIGRFWEEDILCEIGKAVKFFVLERMYWTPCHRTPISLPGECRRAVLTYSSIKSGLSVLSESNNPPLTEYSTK